MGMCTANFRRIEGVEKYRSHSAFSIITKDRTIDILCPTPEIMDQWVLGLRFLVERLRSPPVIQPRIDDHWTLMARLRRGSFLLKFGHSGKPHERYFRVSGNMKLLFWTAGENPIKGLHKSVELTVIKEVRLLSQNPVVAQRGNRIAELLSKGVEDCEFGFSLLNSLGQAVINLVAPNREEFLNWTKGLELILKNFSNPEGTQPREIVHSEDDAPVYDRGDYLEFDAAYLPPGATASSMSLPSVAENEHEPMEKAVTSVVQHADTNSEDGSDADEVEIADDENEEEEESTVGCGLPDGESQRSLVTIPTLGAQNGGDLNVVVQENPPDTAKLPQIVSPPSTSQAPEEPWTPSSAASSQDGHHNVTADDSRGSLVLPDVLEPGLPPSAGMYADGAALLHSLNLRGLGVNSEACEVRIVDR